MNAEERRKEIANLLSLQKSPIAGKDLSERFGVSRQIIVQDVALLRAAGYEILSTHNGYVMYSAPWAERVFKIYHTTLRTEEELNLIVDLGGTVADVFVWHKVYGRMEAKLNIFSRHHVAQFLEGVRSGASSELMHITGGYHYHTVRADSEKILDTIEEALREHDFIVPEI